MQVEVFVVGPVEVNCYILKDEKTKEALLIDPGGNAEQLVAYLKKEGLVIKNIVNTHGHWDHIGANDEVCAATGAEVLIHSADLPMLTDTRLNLSAYMAEPVVSTCRSRCLEEGDFISFGSHSLRVIHIPGHSLGGICLYEEGYLFSGDCLFAGSIGRCDFPGGSEKLLVGGIKEKLLPLPEDTVVYPGHGPKTTIGWEKKHNFYLQSGGFW